MLTHLYQEVPLAFPLYPLLFCTVRSQYKDKILDMAVILQEESEHLLQFTFKLVRYLNILKNSWIPNPCSTYAPPPLPTAQPVCSPALLLPIFKMRSHQPPRPFCMLEPKCIYNGQTDMFVFKFSGN